MSERSAKYFEQAFDFVVVVVAFCFDMKRGKQVESDRLEEVFGQLGAEIAHFVSFEIGFELDE